MTLTLERGSSSSGRTIATDSNWFYTQVPADLILCSSLMERLQERDLDKLNDYVVVTKGGQSSKST